MQKVAVVIVNYKTSDLIQGLINSISEDEIKVSIFILDNGSTQESFEKLLEIKDDRIVILRSAANLGFAGGTNYLLNYISKHYNHIDLIFLLNPDALCTPNVILGLLDIINKNPDSACVSPEIINENGEPGYSGGKINYKKGVVITSSDKFENLEVDSFEVDVFSGCAVLMQLKRLKEVGLFNESLFMYFDEADVSIKFRDLGYKVLFAPKLKILHDHSYTTRNHSFIKTYYMSRNRFKVFSKTMTLYNKVYFIFHEFAYHLKYQRIKNAFYHLKGIYHYYIGRMGNGFTNSK